jgi:cytochrome c553
MAISILAPDSLQQTCSACHNERMVQRTEEPQKARMLLILMAQTQAYLELSEIWQGQQTGGVGSAKAEEFLAQARAEFASARQQWHTFKIALVEDHVRRAFSLAQAATLSLKPDTKK